MERTHLLTSFQDFGLADPISRALKEENYLTPTPIQAQTIPIALTGRDVVGIAQTGTGKTAAFAGVRMALARGSRRSTLKVPSSCSIWVRCNPNHRVSASCVFLSLAVSLLRLLACPFS